MWRNQSGTHLEGFSLKTNFLSDKRCFANCQGTKAINTPSYPGVNPMKHNNDKVDKISPMVQSWHLCLGITNSCLIGSKACSCVVPCIVRTLYCKPSQVPMTRDVIDSRGEPSTIRLLNYYSSNCL